MSEHGSCQRVPGCTLMVAHSGACWVSDDEIAALRAERDELRAGTIQVAELGAEMIAELKAERDGATMLKDMAENALRKAEAERDAAVAANIRLLTDARFVVHAERDRYRAALERIAAGDLCSYGLGDIARAALNGGDDE